MLANIPTAGSKALSAEASESACGWCSCDCLLATSIGDQASYVCVCVYVQAGRGCLSAVPPGEFSQLCEGNLPITMMGADFLHQYGDHYDQQTQVNISSNLALLC